MDQKKITRGETAKRLLAYPEFKEMMAEVQNDLFTGFRTTNMFDADKREELHKQSYALDLLVTSLERYVNIGEGEVSHGEYKPDA